MIKKEYIHKFKTSDGAEFGVRPIASCDKKQLIKGLGQTSKESLRFRFFEYKKEFSDQELKYLTEVDGVNHCAFVIFELESNQGQGSPKELNGVGVGRYVRSQIKQNEAEFAIIVKDQYQGKGIGKTLLKELIKHATANNITKMFGEVDQYNTKMIKMMKAFPEFKLKKSSNLSKSTSRLLSGDIGLKSN